MTISVKNKTLVGGSVSAIVERERTNFISPLVITGSSDKDTTVEILEGATSKFEMPIYAYEPFSYSCDKGFMDSNENVTVRINDSTAAAYINVTAREFN